MRLCPHLAALVVVLLAAPSAEATAKTKAVLTIATPPAGQATLVAFHVRGRASRPPVKISKQKLKVTNGSQLPTGVGVAYAEGTHKRAGTTRRELEITVLVLHQATGAARAAGMTPPVTLQTPYDVADIAIAHTASSLFLGRAPASAFSTFKLPVDVLPPGSALDLARVGSIKALMQGATDYVKGQRDTQAAKDFLTYVNAKATIELSVVLTGFSPVEVMGAVRLRRLNAWVPPARNAAARALADAPIDGLKFVFPPSETTPRQVTNFICPTELPTAAITTTTTPDDTLSCSGGSMPVGTTTSFNAQTSPAPSPGMGGMAIASQGGATTTVQMTGP